MKPFRSFFKNFKRNKKKEEVTKPAVSKGEKYFVTRKNAHEHGMSVDLLGKGFAQKNEKVLALRKNIAKEMGLSSKTIQVLDRLFRLRKAGQLASRGVVSETAAKEMVKFLQERKKDLKLNGEQKSHLEVFDFAIKALNNAIKRGPINMEKAQEIRKGQIEVGANSHYVFDPQGKNKNKPLEVNFVATRLVQGIAQDLIELSLGDKYQKFILQEEKERRKI